MRFIRRIIDALQVWLYLGGNTVLAKFVGRWGTPPAQLPRQTCEDEELEQLIEDLTQPDIDLRGSYTTADITPQQPLHAIDFDEFWNKNQDIDVGRDIAFPLSDRDVN